MAAEEESTVFKLFKSKLEEVVKFVPNLTSLQPSEIQTLLNAVQTGNDVQLKLSTTENGSMQITLLQNDSSLHPNTPLSNQQVILPGSAFEKQDIGEENIIIDDGPKSAMEEWGLFLKEGNVVAEPMKTLASVNQWKVNDEETNSKEDNDIQLPYMGDLNEQENMERPQILVSVMTEDGADHSPNKEACLTSVRPQWYIQLPREPEKNLVDDACEVDTVAVATDMRNFLRSTSISLGNFSKNYLQRTQGTLSDLLNHPKPWKSLSSRGRGVYTKMMEFLNARNIDELVKELKEPFLTVRRGPQISTVPLHILNKLKNGEIPARPTIDAAASKLQLDSDQLMDYCHRQRALYCKGSPFRKNENEAEKMTSDARFGQFKPKYVGKHICPTMGCGVILGCKMALENHLLTHTGEKPFKCLKCNKRFSTQSNMRSHERRHGKAKGKRSGGMSKRAQTATDVRESIDLKPTSESADTAPESPNQGNPQNESYKYMCGACSLGFDSRSLLNDHVTSAHSSAKLRDQQSGAFVCHVCGKASRTVATLTVHLRSHSGQRPFACGKCGKRFRSKHGLRRHEQTHLGKKPFKCPRCPSRFTEAGSVITHLRTHTGERPFECPVCKKRFGQRGTLQAHRNLHEGKSFLCDICGIAFRQKVNLASHVKRSHCGLKRHKCDKCTPPKFFFKKNDLKRHMRTHTGIRSFVCPSCPKSFTRQYFLNEHLLKAHDPATEYKCEKCKMLWPTLDRFQQHLSVCQPSVSPPGGAVKTASIEGGKILSLADSVVKAEAGVDYSPSLLQVKIIGEGILNDGKAYIFSVPPNAGDSQLESQVCCIAANAQDPTNILNPVTSINNALRSDSDPSLSGNALSASSFAVTSPDGSGPMQVAILTNRGVVLSNAHAIDQSLLEAAPDMAGDDVRLKLGLSAVDTNRCEVETNMGSIIVTPDEDNAGYVVVNVSDDPAAFTTEPVTR